MVLEVSSTNMYICIIQVPALLFFFCCLAVACFNFYLFLFFFIDCLIDLIVQFVYLFMYTYIHYLLFT